VIPKSAPNGHSSLRTRSGGSRSRRRDVLEAEAMSQLKAPISHNMDVSVALLVEASADLLVLRLVVRTIRLKPAHHAKIVLDTRRGETHVDCRRSIRFVSHRWWARWRSRSTRHHTSEVVCGLEGGTRRPFRSRRRLPQPLQPKTELVCRASSSS